VTSSEGFVNGVLASMGSVAVASLYFTARTRAGRIVGLVAIFLMVLASGFIVGAAATPSPGRQPTPAPVESTPVCGPGQIGPYQLDGHLMCIPQDQAG
jgi:hypothetical protein